LSQQYWTAYVYASENVFLQAWNEFQNNLNENGAWWEYENAEDGQWLIKRIRENEDWDEDDDDDEDMGDMSYSRYSSLESRIERITERIERERERMEEEQHRREEEERAMKVTAKSQIEKAINEASSALNSEEFERAESILSKQSSAYNRYKTELELSDYDQLFKTIKSKKADWMEFTIKSIRDLIGQRKWEEAKDCLDKLRTDRVSSTGRGNDTQSIREQLNREKIEWEEAERERLRLEKIANEKKASELVIQHLHDWSPTVDDSRLLTDETGFEAFLRSLNSSEVGAFCNEHDAWMNNVEAMKQKADSLFTNAKHERINSMMSKLVHGEVSRENMLTSEILAGESNPLEPTQMQTVLTEGMKIHFPEVYTIMEKNRLTVPQNLVSDFTILFVKARTAYIEEQIKMKNTQLAKAMVGRALKMQDEYDFVSMVEASYIGEHAIRMFVSKNGAREELLTMEEMVAHIEAGSNLVIVLEECYDTDQEMNHGHIKNSKIFE
jgi:hypothetical protein